jgi:drug/metabolite transporter (DMT)-like permease
MTGRIAAPWQAQFVLLAAIWGSSFLCIKVLGEDWAPTWVALGRVGLGALFLVAVLALQRAPLPRGRRLWAHLAVVAFFMNAAPFTLFAYGETEVSSVVAGLWNGTTPLFTLAIVLALLPDERPDRRRLLALAAGFGGVALLLGPWQALGGDVLLGHLACGLGAVCYGCGLPYTRRFLSGRPESWPQLAAVQLVIATAMLVAVAPFAASPTLRIGPDAIASLAVLGILGSGVAYVLTHNIVRVAGATTFSTVTYLIPVVSTALGVAILGEGLSWNQPAGAAIVLGSMWWSSGGQSRWRMRSTSTAAKPIVVPDGSAAAPVSRATRATASATAGATSRLKTEGTM